MRIVNQPLKQILMQCKLNWNIVGNIINQAVREPFVNDDDIQAERLAERGHNLADRYDDDTVYDTSTVRRQQTLPSQQGFYPRETDVDEVPDEDRPQSRLNRHQDDDDEDETSSEGVPDSEASYTLKDRQDAINITHPFGLKIWKPALYKKDRSVQRTAEGEIHSRPGQWPDRKIRLGNVLWTLIFGWWMCIVTAIVALILLVSTWWSGGAPYAFVLFGLARYLFYPFGRFIELDSQRSLRRGRRG